MLVKPTILHLPNALQLAAFVVLSIGLAVIQCGQMVYADVYYNGGTPPIEVIPPNFSNVQNTSALNFSASNYVVLTDGNQTTGNGLRLLFQLNDVRTNQSIPFVTYLINITRISVNSSETEILNEMFQVPSAQPLVLDVQQPSVMEQRCLGGGIDAGTCDFMLSPFHPIRQDLVIHANPDSILGAWVQNSTGRIQLDSPKLLQSGNFSARITIIGVHDARSIFSDKNAPRFEKSWTLAANSAVVPEFPSNLLIVGLAPVIAVILVLIHQRTARNRSTA